MELSGNRDDTGAEDHLEMWARILSLVRGLGFRSTVERDLDDELRFHLEARVGSREAAESLAARSLRTRSARPSRTEQQVTVEN
jgi:hypothetical protein